MLVILLKLNENYYPINSKILWILYHQITLKFGITKNHISDQEYCIKDEAIWIGIGKIVNEETFLNTVIENKTVFGQGKGTIST